MGVGVVVVAVRERQVSAAAPGEAVIVDVVPLVDFHVAVVVEPVAELGGVRCAAVRRVDRSGIGRRPWYAEPVTAHPALGARIRRAATDTADVVVAEGDDGRAPRSDDDQGQRRGDAHQNVPRTPTIAALPSVPKNAVVPSYCG